jgi:siderophore synthetase component
MSDPMAIPPPPSAPPPDERALAARVVSALLREDYGGLAGCVTRDGAGVALRLPVADDGPGIVLPLEPDGFLADFRVPAGTRLTLGDVSSAVAVLAGARDAAGAAVFDAECRRTLAETRLRQRHGDPASRPARVPRRLGHAGQLGYDALAAALPHPAYPASPCRLGLADADLLGYAPEFGPEFELRWAAVRKDTVTRAGHWRAAWWPDPAAVGLPGELAATHDLFPVHPLTTRDLLPEAIRDTGAPVILAPRPRVRVRPTLSVRTVAVADHPAEHVKLPLPASTLGSRNRRSVAPATLADGALVYRLLVAARCADPRLRGLLLADDTGYAHAGHPGLGYLLRRMPARLEGCRVAPVAALAARTPDGRLVIEEMAGRGVLEFAAAYFRLVFGIAVRLLARYGIALESHQQNAALVTRQGRPPLLLVKDFDGTLINLARLRSALGTAAPAAGDFADPRLLTGSDDALADVFITITVHLCAGAVAFALAERGAAPLPALLAEARRALEEALRRERGRPAADLLRARVLDAPRLPGKSMITAGTLTAKEHTGAADVNKFYGTDGPNYLREVR